MSSIGLKRYIKNHAPGWLVAILRSLYWRFYGKSFRKIWSEINKEKGGACSCRTTGEKISVICSVWNLSPDVLEEMLDSVCHQKYRDWELCINCCCDADRTELRAMLKRYRALDNRIKVAFHKNRGIALNSNIAADMASGSWVMLLDHDDILSPYCLGLLAAKASEMNADFVYSEEYVMYMKYNRRCRKTRKGEYSLQRLHQDNYINHPAMIRKSLFESIGGFREGFDGSQDYDLYLRLVERTDRIAYVPKALYFWRINEGSFSQKALGICIASGKKALEEHYRRMHLNMEVRAMRNEARYISVSCKDSDACHASDNLSAKCDR